MNSFFDDFESENLIYKTCSAIINRVDDCCLGKDIDEKLIEKLQLFSHKGESIENISKEILENIMPYCTDFHNPNFMGFPDSGNSMAGILGSFTSELLQQNLINSNICSPIATHIEIAVINWFRKLIGYDSCICANSVDDVGGIITNGGTVSNSIAMLLAKENSCPNSLLNGCADNVCKYVVVPKSISHYSIGASLCWIGCGNRIIECETSDFRYDLDDLKNVLQKHKNRIMGVIVYAGDSRTMTIENIRDVCNLVKNFDKDIWVHADACNGFCLAMSSNLRAKLDGIELCDSISMDPHKMLMLSYTSSILLVKNPENMKKIKTKSDLIMTDDMSFGQITPFMGSKPWMSLKIWCLIKRYGKDGLELIINERYNNAQLLKQKIEKNSNLKLINAVDAFSVVFMYYPSGDIKDIKLLNRLNIAIHDRMVKEKKYYLHQFPLTIKETDGSTFVVYPQRFFSGNINLNEEILDQMVEYVCKTGEYIYENSLY